MRELLLRRSKMDELIKELRDRAASIIEALPGAKWEYDDRFLTALYCYETDKSEQINTVLSEMLEQHWDFKSFKKGGKTVKKLVKELAGLKKDQFLYTSGEELLIYAVLWPWGDGTTVSLRIGLYSLKDKKFNDEGCESYIKEWFDFK